MRMLWLAAMLALGTASSALPPAGAEVRGVVTEAGTGTPIADAEILLMYAGAAPGTISAAPGGLTLAIVGTPDIFEIQNASILASSMPSSGLPLGVGPSSSSSADAARSKTRTDTHGRFEIKNIPPGKYILIARKDEFVAMPAANGVSAERTTVQMDVTAAGNPPELAIAMARGASVAGRVIDADGKPAKGHNVVPYVLTYRDGRATLISGGRAQKTDSRGEYRLYWLGSGEYYIAAAAPSLAQGVPSTVNPSRTYFPGVSDPAMTSSLFVKAGSEMKGIDIALERPSPTFAIRGRTASAFSTPQLPRGAEPAVTGFVLMPRDAGIEDNIPAPIMNLITRRGGDFEILGVRPGLYDLFPSMNALVDGVQRPVSGRVAVEVRAGDAKGVVLPVKPGTDVRGTIRIKGDSGALKLSSLRVALRPMDNLPAPFVNRMGEQAVDDRGGFLVKFVPESRYALFVNALPENVYVSDIRAGNASVFDSGFVSGQDATNAIEVILEGNGQTVDGAAVNASGKPAAGATVALVPPEARRQNVALYRMAVSDAAGRFRITGVAPGDYKIFAWERTAPGAWQSAAFVGKYEAQGRAVKVGGQGVSGVQVKAGGR